MPTDTPLTAARRPFHDLDELANEKGRNFDGLFVPKADGLAQEDLIATLTTRAEQAEAELRKARERWVGCVTCGQSWQMSPIGICPKCQSDGAAAAAKAKKTAEARVAELEAELRGHICAAHRHGASPEAACLPADGVMRSICRGARAAMEGQR